MAKQIILMRSVLAGVLALGLAACGTTPKGYSDEPVTRALTASDPLETPDLTPALQTFQVTDIQVNVPRTLRVSEANRYYPGGDIVWREDPMGDRHQQVADIVLAGLQRGADRLNGTRPVRLDVVVTRFHALSEKARYTFGGVHAIQFDLTVLDAETGQPLAPPRRIKADFDALGGAAAIGAEQRGITQKVRIVDHLAKVIQDELSKPEGYHQEDTGLIGALNQI